ncbi:Outer-membrane-phospholipid-binding lipoprotein MlaA [hydrothermal vent metagenome]|uniref:Outer-membrane-phospholipid-binding lipoprotein MlaA n=1 Tax=hydrothermal vent metagenome TaxID=652676 RepID=A0A3B1AB39_9ZZZZ
MQTLKTIKSLLLTITIAITTASCASVNGPSPEHDPFESYNRAMFSFNDAVDRAVLKPVAAAYKGYVPSPIRTGVSNFFSNLGDILVVINDLLQGKFSQARDDTIRVIYNTFFGLFGLIDVATYMGLPKHHEDFGQTLAVWGVSDGPYLVLPLLGPSTIRDTAGLLVDAQADPVYSISDTEARYATVGLKAVDTRADLLGASKVLDQAAFDRYAFLRDAYLQRRKHLVYDGNPPRDENSQPTPSKDSAEDLLLEEDLEKALQ